MTKIYNIQKMRERRKQLRKESTVAEQVMWQAIRNSKLSYKFRRQYSIGPYVTDFCCPELKLIVELDGAYHDYDEQVIYDKEREYYLREFGFDILHIKNEEVRYNYIEVAEKIKEACLRKELQN
ncbi:hypothetical protein A3I35_01640 [Candidatus Falkowbacteria bacterium RIFCSPLOWO2_02_FULL_45_15]|nr:MAG: hypothetical protein A3I35_01640 [Candidatus Falkowbacteria bacterium RIFCSPLOWO2_02_FULL_45_15]